MAVRKGDEEREGYKKICKYMKIINIHIKINDDLGRDYHCTGYVLQRLSPLFFCTAGFKIYFSRKYKIEEHDTKGPQSAGRSLSLVSGSSNSSPLSLLFKLLRMTPERPIMAARSHLTDIISVGGHSAIERALHDLSTHLVALGSTWHSTSHAR